MSLNVRAKFGPTRIFANFGTAAATAFEPYSSASKILVNTPAGKGYRYVIDRVVAGLIATSLGVITTPNTTAYAAQFRVTSHAGSGATPTAGGTGAVSPVIALSLTGTSTIDMDELNWRCRENEGINFDVWSSAASRGIAIMIEYHREPV